VSTPAAVDRRMGTRITEERVKLVVPHRGPRVSPLVPQAPTAQTSVGAESTAAYRPEVPARHARMEEVTGADTGTRAAPTPDDRPHDIGTAQDRSLG
jgi:hypothetical protein